jgi:hypothetical protein
MSNTYYWQEDGDYIITGAFIFNMNPEWGQLGEVARKWKEEEPESWLELAVQANRKREYSIHFRYNLRPDPNTGEYVPGKDLEKQFVHKFTDKLKRLFGNDYLWWDITREVYRLVEKTA